MVQLKKKVTLKTKIADSDVKQDIQPKNTAPQEPVNKTGGGNKRLGLFGYSCFGCYIVLCFCG